MVIVGRQMQDMFIGCNTLVGVTIQHISFGKKCQEADIVGCSVEHRVAVGNHFGAVAPE